MHDAAHGRDERDVITRWSRNRSAAKRRSSAICPRLRDREELSQIFTALCTGVSDDLRRKGYLGKTIGLKLRYDNFKTVTRDRTLDWPTDDPHAIRRAAGECLKRVPLDRRIRLLGVRVGALFAASAVGPAPPAEPAEATPSLFDESANADAGARDGPPDVDSLNGLGWWRSSHRLTSFDMFPPTSHAASKATSEKFSPRIRPNCVRMFASGSSDEKAMAAVCSPNPRSTKSFFESAATCSWLPPRAARTLSGSSKTSGRHITAR